MENEMVSTPADWCEASSERGKNLFLTLLHNAESFLLDVHEA